MLLRAVAALVLTFSSLSSGLEVMLPPVRREHRGTSSRIAEKADGTNEMVSNVTRSSAAVVDVAAASIRQAWGLGEAIVGGEMNTCTNGKYKNEKIRNIIIIKSNFCKMILIRSQNDAEITLKWCRNHPNIILK